jgi:transcriptional regulator with XRE-family HTH domain
MDFSNQKNRKVVSKAIGTELRRIRESRDLSRVQFVARFPSGIGERTLLAYEHGLRELTVLRLLELCYGLDAEPTNTLRLSLQRASLGMDNLALQVDLTALLSNNRRNLFRPLSQWARYKLGCYPGEIAELTPAAVRELADFMGCSHHELAAHLAQFAPEDED